MCDYKNKTCNFCENVQINRIKSSDRYNIYCNYNDVERMVDLSVPPKAYVEIPSWCPKNKKVASSALSFADKMSLLRKMTPLIKWDEIEVNTVYHLPQLPGEERNDIIVEIDGTTVKNSAHLKYLLYKHNIGDTVKLTIVRGGNEKELTLKLTQRIGDSN